MELESSDIDGDLTGTVLGKSFCIAAVDRLADLERKIPIIPMIDACCMTDLVLSDSNCTMGPAKRSLCGSCGLEHAGNCSSTVVTTW